RSSAAGPEPPPSKRNRRSPRRPHRPPWWGTLPWSPQPGPAGPSPSPQEPSCRWCSQRRYLPACWSRRPAEASPWPPLQLSIASSNLSNQDPWEGSHSLDWAIVATIHPVEVPRPEGETLYRCNNLTQQSLDNQDHLY